jgi:hypothetical protein
LDTLNFLRLYNVATTVYFPLTDKGTLDLALSADYTPASGDAWISVDGGAFAQSTNTIAVVSGDKGMWELDLTAAELLGKTVCITIIDAAGAEIEDQSLVVTTYGHTSAEIDSLDSVLDAADALLKRDIDQVEASAAVHSLLTAILKAVSKVEDASGVEKTYETDGTTLKMSRTLTTDPTAQPISQADVGA